MAYVADLHIHSRFSRACSQQLNIPNLVEWAKLKGIDLLGTGDFLHPLWLTELKNQLSEDGSGFLTFSKDPSVKFLLTVEIASMYSHKGKGRRIHNLVFLPDFQSAEKFQKALLSKHATLASDGRPIVGIPSKDLLSMALEASDKALFVPSHLWTPWFGLFGSESGYDSLEECFEDMVGHVYGIETGLSSDPAMNWRITELDSRSILSFSDAHSLPNLGREVTVLAENLKDGYEGLYQAIKNQKIAGTIEFYPEEGKYHYTGHRMCGIKYSPEDTNTKGTTCPRCGRSLTVGVMERVEKLASRDVGEIGVKRPGYRKLVPLLQIIAEALNSAPTTQKVLNEYKKLTISLGSEIKVLTKTEITEIAKIAGPKIAEGVEKVRKGDLVIDPGYDGVYGVVKIWSNEEKEVEEQKSEAPQLELFD
ncbi:MAG: endonuclease Q family protein [Patescibacteria group bacterium]